MRFLRRLFRTFSTPHHYGGGLRGRLRNFQALSRQHKIDAQVEAKRVSQLRQDAGTDVVEARVEDVEREVREQMRPALDDLDRERREAKERAQGALEPGQTLD